MQRTALRAAADACRSATKQGKVFNVATESQRIYVFDADGVLIEPWGFAHALREQFGIDREKTSPFFSGPFMDCLVGRTDIRGVLPDYLEKWGWPLSMDEFIQLWMKSDNDPRIEVMEVVQKLRRTGALCCLASNQETTRARYMETEMGFAQAFDALYFSCDLGTMKPRSDYYRYIESDLSVSPSRIHFWDDSPSHVRGAQDAGWNAYVYEELGSINRQVKELVVE